MKLRFTLGLIILCMTTSCSDSNSIIDFKHIESLGYRISNYSQTDINVMKNHRENYCSRFPEDIIKLMLAEEILAFYIDGDTILSRYASDVEYVQNRAYFNDLFIRSYQIKNLDLDLYKELLSPIQSQVLNHDAYKEFKRKEMQLKQLAAEKRIDIELLGSDKINENEKEDIVDNLKKKNEKSNEIRNDFLDLPLCLQSVVFLGITSSKDSDFIEVMGAINEIILNNHVKKSQSEFNTLMQDFGR